jgi:hypothetical protein
MPSRADLISFGLRVRLAKKKRRPEAALETNYL